jgi:hypothetical protein
LYEIYDPPLPPPTNDSSDEDQSDNSLIGQTIVKKDKIDTIFPTLVKKDLFGGLSKMVNSDEGPSLFSEMPVLTKSNKSQAPKVSANLTLQPRPLPA